ncbi:hypothetical protein Ancab_006776 [Ancistrocladus abbreviatus]
MALNSISKESSSNDKRWVIEIQNFFEEEFDDDAHDMPVSIFNVPKAHKAIKPEAYTPQLVALGPYHHWREDLYEMERYKLVCAKRVQAQFKNLEFQHLVDELVKLEYHIRACYHKHLDMDRQTLAWLMVIDGLFLLEFLHAYADKSHSVLASSARMSHLVDPAGKKVAHDSILKDILMLENQLPICVLKKILHVKFSSSDIADDMLPLVLIGICKQVSPLKYVENYPPSEVIENSHLLDLLYHLIIPRADQQQQGEEDLHIKEDEEEANPSTFKYFETPSKTWNLSSRLNVGVIGRLKNLNLWSKLNNGVVDKLKNLTNSKPMTVVHGMPMNIIPKVPALSPIAPLGNFLPSDVKEAINPQNSANDSKSPSVEEILIPSVSELCDAGVKFCPGGDLTTIKFDSKDRKFYLPVIHLDSHTEVVMRNLVAYEALALSGPLVFARYTELMNGIIDTPEDVKLLRENKILVNHLKSDKEVADLWNGMSKTIRLTEVPHIDQAIADANAYYDSTPRVKFCRLMKKYVYGSWRMLIVLVTVLLLGLMALQSFCSVYNCHRVLNLNGQTNVLH